MKNSLYDRFSPDERAALYDAALLRGDHDEARLLLETCPRKVMRVRDPDFVAAVKSAPGELLAPQEITLAELKSCPRCAAREEAAREEQEDFSMALADDTPLGKLLHAILDALMRPQNRREHLLDAIAVAQAAADDPELTNDTRPIGIFNGKRRI